MGKDEGGGEETERKRQRVRKRDVYRQMVCPSIPLSLQVGDLTMVISIAQGSKQHLKSNPLFST